MIQKAICEVEENREKLQYCQFCGLYVINACKKIKQAYVCDNYDID